MTRLLKIGRSEDAEPQVSETPGNLKGTGAGHERLVQFAKHRVAARHERVDAPAPGIVVQPAGEDLGLTQVLPRQPGFTELGEHRPQLEADLEGLLKRGPNLRQRL
jgi:hypothetical protein